MIVNIRGTSGSGKSYTAFSFMKKYAPSSVILMNDGKTAAHCVYYKMAPVYFIGSYKTICGGCDAIATQDLACSLVRHFSQLGHVVFEGLLMSHLFARYKALYDELTGEGQKMVFAFMDTPIDVCLYRVKERRLAKGNIKEFNPANTISHHGGTFATVPKFEAAGCEIRYIDHTRSHVAQLRALLDEDPILFEDSYREESFR